MKHLPHEIILPPRERKRRRRWATLVLTAALLLLASGCALAPGGNGSRNRAAGVTADQQALNRGLEAFQTGDYRRAGELFERLRSSGDPQVARKALYGLACARLVLAETPAQYAAALVLWQEWNRRAPLKYRDEDPRMLAPLLGRLLSPRAVRKPAPAKKTAGGQSATVPAKRYRACQDRLREMETRISNMEAQKKLLQYYVDYTGKLEGEIWNLKHKINSLEAIDKKILEKKKELSSP